MGADPPSTPEPADQARRPPVSLPLDRARPRRTRLIRWMVGTVLATRRADLRDPRRASVRRVVDSGRIMPEVDGKFWNDAAQSALAGVVPALVATSLLEFARTCRRWIARRRDVKYLRDLLTEGRQRVLKATDLHRQDANAKCRADVIRAAQYNNMIKKLDTGLEKWTANLSHTQRKDVLDALNWYHTNSLSAVKRNGEFMFVEVPDGKWPTTTMSLTAAEQQFGRVQEIRWLKLPPVAGD